MLAYYLISIDGVPYKLYKTNKDVNNTIDWFRRMTRYNNYEYNDYDEFINSGLYFSSNDNIDSRVRVDLVEVYE